MPKLTFWYEFASTYSYLAAMRVEDVARNSGVDVIWQPFLLGPILRSQGMPTSPFNLYPVKGEYMWRDMARGAQKLGLPPITCPNPFPQNGLLAARIALIGMEDGWGPAFTRAVYSAEFAEGRQIDDKEMLGKLITAQGADASGVLDRAATDEGVKSSLRSATERAAELGLFGAPSFTTTDSELFWGNDRLEDALNWAKSESSRSAAARVVAHP